MSRFFVPFTLALCAAAPALGAEIDTAPRVQEPAVKQIVVEDDHVRIEELRVRGQTQRITVHPKGAGLPYEIVPIDAGRDLPGVGERRSNAGQSLWHVLSF